MKEQENEIEKEKARKGCVIEVIALGKIASTFTGTPENCLS